MSTENLEIIIDATVQNGVKGVHETVAGLKTIPPAASKAGVALDKMGKSANQTSTTLFNFGRVVQDAPFGILGIANNIDPLVSSFQALRTSTGSTGLAFKALAGSLLGPAGIGIAVSAVTSALIAFGPKLFGASKEAKELDKALTGVATSAADDLVKLQTYVSFANDASKATSERQKAVKALKDEYPEYLKNLSDEAILTGAATDAINKSIDAILKRATIKLLQDEIAGVVEETAKQIIAIQKQVAVQKNSNKTNKEQAEQLKETKAQLDSFRLKTLQTGQATSEANNKIALSAERAFGRKPETLIAELKKQLIELVAPLLNISDSFSDFAGGTKGLKGKTKEFSDFVQGLKVQLSELKDIADKDPFAKITASTTKLVNQFQDLKSKGKLTAQDIIDAPGIIAAIDKLQKEAVNIELFDNETKKAAKQSAENWALVYKESLKKSLSQIVPAIPEISSEDAVKSLKNAIIGLDAQMTKLGLLTTTQLASFSDQYTALLRDTAASFATAIGDGIASAVTGMGNPFASLINVLGAGLKALGQMYIKIGVEMLIAQKAIKAIANNPYLTIAAGIALQALGSILQQKAQSQTKLAEGGIVSGPMNAQIGEAGQSEVILPLSRLSSILSNNRGMVVMETRISGQDILLVQSRAAGSRGRTYG